mmetsp:Transcript_23587/g.74384  ORF Transcript_23587/g.74384 Transcript_23587/m.74384 type:complete len:273 (-) Transcript_23587:885-1703(-)
MEHLEGHARRHLQRQGASVPAHAHAAPPSGGPPALTATTWRPSDEGLRQIRVLPNEFRQAALVLLQDVTALLLEQRPTCTFEGAITSEHAAEVGQDVVPAEALAEPCLSEGAEPRQLILIRDGEDLERVLRAAVCWLEGIGSHETQEVFHSGSADARVTAEVHLALLRLPAARGQHAPEVLGTGRKCPPAEVQRGAVREAESQRPDLLCQIHGPPVPGERRPRLAMHRRAQDPEAVSPSRAALRLSDEHVELLIYGNHADKVIRQVEVLNAH